MILALANVIELHVGNNWNAARSEWKQSGRLTVFFSRSGNVTRLMWEAKRLLIPDAFRILSGDPA